MSQIEQIRAEIERRIEKYGQDYQLLTLLEFIDNLERKEQPVELYDEIAKIWANTCHLNEKKDKRIVTLNSMEFCDIARHFYELGRSEKPNNHLEQPVCEGLEEAAHNAATFHLQDGRTIEDSERYIGFIAGAKWQKEQMKKTLLNWAKLKRFDEGEFAECYQAMIEKINSL